MIGPPPPAAPGAATPLPPAWVLAVRSGLFAAGMALSTLIVGSLAVFILPLPYPWRYRIVTRWSAFNLWWLTFTCRLRWHIEGREHVPERPTIVLCKHQSAWETIGLQLVFNPQTWVLKRELLWVPLFGWGLGSLEPIPINRASGRRAVEQIIAIGCERLRQGRWVVIFPEGTRTPAGQRQRYKIGGAALAEASGYPVVPVAHNAGDYWARRRFIKRPGTIRMVIGPVIESRGKSAADINKAAEAWIESTVERIRREDPNVAARESTAGD